MLPTFTPCVPPMFSLFIFLICPAPISIPHFVFSRCRKSSGIHQVVIFTAPKGLPKMSARQGRAFVFITLFISKGDNNNTNNKLDLNGSKGNINFTICFILMDSRAVPAGRLLCTAYLRAALELVLLIWKWCLLINQWQSVNGSSEHSALLSAFVIVFTGGSHILGYWGVTCSVQNSVRENYFITKACKSGRLFFHDTTYYVREQYVWELLFILLQWINTLKFFIFQNVNMFKAYFFLVLHVSLYLTCEMVQWIHMNCNE